MSMVCFTINSIRSSNYSIVFQVRVLCKMNFAEDSLFNFLYFLENMF